MHFRLTQTLRRLASGAVLACTLAITGVAHADAYPYDTFPGPERGLRFADLEFSAPWDPYLREGDTHANAYRTTAHLIAYANDQLQAAVPAGMSVADATAVLRKAGAHCAQPSGHELSCRYRDLQNTAEYSDSVLWTVSMPIADGRVQSLNVTRDWLRH